MDIEQADTLRDYVASKGLVDNARHAKATVLRGGVSNRTVLLEHGGDAWVFKQALEKLRVQVDWYSNPERIHREAAGMRYLKRFAPAGSITPLVFEDEAEHILAMEAVPQPHENWKAMLLRGGVEREHVAQFGTLLGCVHRGAFLANEASGEVAEVFADRSYFEALRLEPYYLYAAEQTPEAADFLNVLVADTRKRRFTLVHGDYSPKNVLVHKGKLILLDHEVIHFGDPAFDLGFGMTHLLSKAHHVRGSRDTFVDAAALFWSHYQKTLGDVTFAELETYAVRHTLGCLLARVAGRSPLEYLSAEEKARQKQGVMQLMEDEPETVAQLAERFVGGLKGG